MREEGSCSREFGSYALFRLWAVESGYTPGAALVRENDALPFSRDNCAWELAEAHSEEAAAEWDRAIDRIRRRLGLEPIISTSPCVGCRKTDGDGTCETVCKARKRYWDASMARLRKGLGVKGENNG